jgi:hypothetical protein
VVILEGGVETEDALDGQQDAPEGQYTYKYSSAIAHVWIAAPKR